MFTVLSHSITRLERTTFVGPKYMRTLKTNTHTHEALDLKGGKKILHPLTLVNAKGAAHCSQ